MRGRSDHDTYDLAWGPLAPRISRGSRTAPPEYDRPTSALPTPEPPEPSRVKRFALMAAREAAAVAERAAQAAQWEAIAADNRAAQDARDADEAARMMERARLALARSLEPATAPEPVQPTGPAIMACDRCGSQGIAINPDRSTVWYCPAGYGCSQEATDADL
jgi:hypothetical protein